MNLKSSHWQKLKRLTASLLALIFLFSSVTEGGTLLPVSAAEIESDAASLGNTDNADTAAQSESGADLLASSGNANTATPAADEAGHTDTPTPAPEESVAAESASTQIPQEETSKSAADAAVADHTDNNIEETADDFPLLQEEEAGGATLVGDVAPTDVASVTIESTGVETGYATLAQAVSAANSATENVTLTILQADENGVIEMPFAARMNFGEADRQVTITSAPNEKFTIRKAYGGNNNNSPVRGKNLVLRNIIIDGNRNGLNKTYWAATEGGVVQVRPNGTLLMDNASAIGGLLAGSGTNNARGGGVHGMTGSDIWLTNNSLVENNAAIISGGGIYGETIIIEDSIVRDNAAGVTVSGATNNAADRDGGGIYATKSLTIIGNSQVSGNSASRYGGGIAIKDDASFDTPNNDKEVTAGNLSMTVKAGITLEGDVSITDNTAQTTAGGVYAGTGAAVIQVQDNVRITGNTQGSGTSATDSNLYIPDSTNKFGKIQLSGDLGSAAYVGVSIEGSTGAVLTPADADWANAFASAAEGTNGANRLFSDADSDYAGKLENGSITWLESNATVSYLSADTGKIAKQSVEINSTITVDPNGGTIDNHTEAYPIVVGAPLSLPTQGTKGKYQFGGYVLSGDAQIGYTFTAIWNEVLTVVSYLDANTGEQSTVTAYRGDTILVDPQGGLVGSIIARGTRRLTAETYQLDSTNAVKEGYEFVGWSVSGDRENGYSFDAVWRDIYTISYLDAGLNEEKTFEIVHGKSIFVNASGGTIDGQSSRAYTVESADFAIPTPERSDYQFKGWILKSGSGSYTYTLTAKWMHNDGYRFRVMVNNNNVWEEVDRLSESSLLAAGGTNAVIEVLRDVDLDTQLLNLTGGFAGGVTIRSYTGDNASSQDAAYTISRCYTGAGPFLRFEGRLTIENVIFDGEMTNGFSNTSGSIFFARSLYMKDGAVIQNFRQTAASASVINVTHDLFEMSGTAKVINNASDATSQNNGIIRAPSRFTMRDNAIVSDNTTAGDMLITTAAFTMDGDDSASPIIRDNTSSGAAVIRASSQFNMFGNSSIYGNSARDSIADGAGSAYAVFREAASIKNNSMTSESGAAVYGFGSSSGISVQGGVQIKSNTVTGSTGVERNVLISNASEFHLAADLTETASIGISVNGEAPVFDGELGVSYSVDARNADCIHSDTDTSGKYFAYVKSDSKLHWHDGTSFTITYADAATNGQTQATIKIPRGMTFDIDPNHGIRKNTHDAEHVSPTGDYTITGDPTWNNYWFRGWEPVKGSGEKAYIFKAKWERDPATIPSDWIVRTTDDGLFWEWYKRSDPSGRLNDGTYTLLAAIGALSGKDAKNSVVEIRQDIDLNGQIDAVMDVNNPDEGAKSFTLRSYSEDNHTQPYVIKRAFGGAGDDYAGSMIKAQNMILEDIVIDGGETFNRQTMSATNQFTIDEDGSALSLQGVLTMKKGAVIKNHTGNTVVDVKGLVMQDDAEICDNSATGMVIRAAEVDTWANYYAADLSNTAKITYNISNYGALYAGNVTLNDSAEVSHNVSQKSGGGIFSMSSVSLNDACKVEDNEARGGFGGGVVAYYRYGQGLTINGGSLARNKASGNGGGAAIFGNFIMNGGSVDHNSASQSGGGIYQFPREYYIANMAYTGFTLSTYSSGGYYQQAFTMTGGEITNNHAGGTGGGALGGHFRMTGGRIEYNAATNAGGYANIQKRYGLSHNDNTPYLVRNASISHNTANASYGGIMLYAADGETYKYIDLNIEGNTVIEENRALNGSGGGVTVLGDTQNTIKLSDSAKILNNSASQDGGGIFRATATSGKIELSDNAIVQENSAGQNGGGIYAWGQTTTVTGKALVYKNTAGQNGGGVFSDPTSKKSGSLNLLQEGKITENTAGVSGGGAYIAHKVVVTGGDQTVYNSVAEAALATGPAEVGPVVSGNTAGTSGGGIYLGSSKYADQGTLVLSGKASISGNTADVGGGAFVANSVFLKDSVYIQQNTKANGTDPSNLYVDKEGTPITMLDAITSQEGSIGVGVKGNIPTVGEVDFATTGNRAWTNVRAFRSDEPQNFYGTNNPKDATKLYWTDCAIDYRSADTGEAAKLYMASGRKIKIDPNGGSWTNTTGIQGTTDANGVVTLPINASTTTIQDPTLSGKLFLGWLASQGESDDVSWVLTAIWEYEARATNDGVNWKRFASVNGAFDYIEQGGTLEDSRSVELFKDATLPLPAATEGKVFTLGSYSGEGATTRYTLTRAFSGAAMINADSVMLKNIVVDGGESFDRTTMRMTTSNYTADGSAAAFELSGSLHMENGALIRNHKAESDVVTARGLYMNDTAQVSDNAAPNGRIIKLGTFKTWTSPTTSPFALSGHAKVIYNSSRYGALCGTGQLSGDVEVAYNNSSAHAAGVFASSLTMTDRVKIHNNTTSGYGGGILAGSVTMGGAVEVYNNSALLGGGGMFVFGAVTLTGGKIHHNLTTSGSGGGVHQPKGNCRYDYTNNAVDANYYDSYSSSTQWYFTMNAGEITNNKATSGNGGGVYGGVLRMTGGKIEYNEAKNGGGFYNVNAQYGGGSSTSAGSSHLIQNASVSHNTASGSYGGLLLVTVENGSTFSYMTLDLQDGAVIEDNKANGGSGGGIGIVQGPNNSPIGMHVNILGSAKIVNNYASVNGGGIFRDKNGNGIFRIRGNAKIEENKAGQNGGGLYVNGHTIYVGGNCSINGNEAGQNGGGIYTYKESNNLPTAQGSISLFANPTIANNKAGQDGGGLFAGYGVYLSGIDTPSDVYTPVDVLTDGIKISGNTAVRDGGGVYAGSEFTKSSSATTIYASGSYGLVSLLGTVQISGNEAGQNGGGAYAESDVSVKENVTITGNTRTAGQTPSNLYVNAEGAPITMTGPLTSGEGAIGVSIKGDIPSTDLTDFAVTENVSWADTRTFRADNPQRLYGAHDPINYGKLYWVDCAIKFTSADLYRSELTDKTVTRYVDPEIAVELDPAGGAWSNTSWLDGPANASGIFEKTVSAGSGIFEIPNPDVTNGQTFYGWKLAILNAEGTKIRLHAVWDMEARLTNDGGENWVEYPTVNGAFIDVAQNTTTSRSIVELLRDAELPAPADSRDKDFSFRSSTKDGNTQRYALTRAYPGSTMINADALLLENIVIDGGCQSFDEKNMTFGTSGPLATGDGVAITAGDLVMNEGTLIQNHSAFGTIVEAATITTTDALITHNISQKSVLYATAGFTLQGDTELSYNKSGHGAIFGGLDSVMRDTAHAVHNEATRFAGGVYCSAGLRMESGTYIKSNKAPYGGGAVADWLSLSGATVEHNKATYHGGGLIALKYGTINYVLDAQDSVIQNNLAMTGDGGGVYISGHRYVVKTETDGTKQFATLASTVSVTSNTSKYAPNTALTNSEIVSNSAPNGNGGGIFGGGLVMTDGHLDNNTAKNGGGFYRAVCDANVNTSRDYQSGIKINGSASISGNTAEINGGAMVINSNRGTFRSDTYPRPHAIRVTLGGNAIIENNKATSGHGGAVFISETLNESGDGAPGTEALVQGNVKIRKNSAADSGGGIMMGVKQSSSIKKGNTITLSGNASVTENQAGRYGGGICLYHSEFSMLDTAKITGNEAGLDGGGIYSESTYDDITDGRQITGHVEIFGQASIAVNTSKSGNGGGIYANAPVLLEAIASGDNVGINGNKAENGDGGGLYVALPNWDEISKTAYNYLYSIAQEDRAFVQYAALVMHGNVTIDENRAKQAGGVHCAAQIGIAGDVTANTNVSTAPVTRTNDNAGELFAHNIYTESTAKMFGFIGSPRKTIGLTNGNDVPSTEGVKFADTLHAGYPMDAFVSDTAGLAARQATGNATTIVWGNPPRYDIFHHKYIEGEDPNETASRIASTVYDRLQLIEDGQTVYGVEKGHVVRIDPDGGSVGYENNQVVKSDVKDRNMQSDLNPLQNPVRKNAKAFLGWQGEQISGRADQGRRVLDYRLVARYQELPSTLLVEIRGKEAGSIGAMQEEGFIIPIGGADVELTNNTQNIAPVKKTTSLVEDTESLLLRGQASFDNSELEFSNTYTFKQNTTDSTQYECPADKWQVSVDGNGQVKVVDSLGRAEWSGDTSETEWYYRDGRLLIYNEPAQVRGALTVKKQISGNDTGSFDFQMTVDKPITQITEGMQPTLYESTGDTVLRATGRVENALKLYFGTSTETHYTFEFTKKDGSAWDGSELPDNSWSVTATGDGRPDLFSAGDVIYIKTVAPGGVRQFAYIHLRSGAIYRVPLPSSATDSFNYQNTNTGAYSIHTAKATKWEFSVNGNSSKTISGLMPGTVCTVQENISESQQINGWELAEVDGRDGVQSSQTTIRSGETLTTTFVNRKNSIPQRSVVVKKVAEGGSGERFDFSFSFRNSYVYRDLTKAGMELKFTDRAVNHQKDYVTASDYYIKKEGTSYKITGSTSGASNYLQLTPGASSEGEAPDRTWSASYVGDASAINLPAPSATGIGSQGNPTDPDFMVYYVTDSGYIYCGFPNHSNHENGGYFTAADHLLALSYEGVYWTFTLSAGEEIVIPRLPEDTEYDVQESISEEQTDAGWKLASIAAPEGSVTSVKQGTVSGSMGLLTQTVTYTNALEKNGSIKIVKETRDDVQGSFEFRLDLNRQAALISQGLTPLAYETQDALAYELAQVENNATNGETMRLIYTDATGKNVIAIFQRLSSGAWDGAELPDNTWHFNFSDEDGAEVLFDNSDVADIASDEESNCTYITLKDGQVYEFPMPALDTASGQRTVVTDGRAIKRGYVSGWRVSLIGPGSRTIKRIPVGTQYTLTELPKDQWKLVSVDGVEDVNKAGGTVRETEESSTFLNKNVPNNSIVVEKEVNGSETGTFNYTLDVTWPSGQPGDLSGVAGLTPDLNSYVPGSTAMRDWSARTHDGVYDITFAWDSAAEFMAIKLTSPEPIWPNAMSNTPYSSLVPTSAWTVEMGTGLVSGMTPPYTFVKVLGTDAQGRTYLLTDDNRIFYFYSVWNGVFGGAHDAYANINGHFKKYNFTLDAGESITIPGIPAGTDYTVTESLTAAQDNDGWSLKNVEGSANDATITGNNAAGTAKGTMATAGHDITFTNEKAPVIANKTIEFTKTWSDSNNEDGLRPDSIELTLQQKSPQGNWTTYRTVNVTGDTTANTWTYTFADVPIYTDDAYTEEYDYKIVETPVAHYTADNNGEATYTKGSRTRIVDPLTDTASLTNTASYFMVTKEFDAGIPADSEFSQSNESAVNTRFKTRFHMTVNEPNSTAPHIFNANELPTGASQNLYQNHERYGEITFDLNHGQDIVFDCIDEDWTVNIWEENIGSFRYYVKWKEAGDTSETEWVPDGESAAAKVPIGGEMASGRPSFTMSGHKHVTFINHAPTVIVTKYTDDENTSQTFDFTLTNYATYSGNAYSGPGLNFKAPGAPTIIGSNYEISENGDSIDFSLRHGQSIVFIDVPTNPFGYLTENPTPGYLSQYYLYKAGTERPVNGSGYGYRYIINLNAATADRSGVNYLDVVNVTNTSTQYGFYKLDEYYRPYKSRSVKFETNTFTLQPEHGTWVNRSETYSADYEVGTNPGFVAIGNAGRNALEEGQTLTLREVEGGPTTTWDTLPFVEPSEGSYLTITKDDTKAGGIRMVGHGDFANMLEEVNGYYILKNRIETTDVTISKDCIGTNPNDPNQVFEIYLAIVETGLNGDPYVDPARLAIDAADQDKVDISAPFTYDNNLFQIKISLKDGESVTLHDVPSQATMFVMEKEESYWHSLLNRRIYRTDEALSAINGYVLNRVMAHKNDIQVMNFVNAPKQTRNLTIRKKLPEPATNTATGTFWFEVKFGNANREAVYIPPYASYMPLGAVVQADNSIRFPITFNDEHDKSVQFTNLPYGLYVYLQEVEHEGYNAYNMISNRGTHPGNQDNLIKAATVGDVVIGPNYDESDPTKQDKRFIMNQTNNEMRVNFLNVPIIKGAALTLETRERPWAKVGKETDTATIKAGGSPTSIAGAKFTLTPIDANGAVIAGGEPIESGLTGTNGKVVVDVPAGTYLLEETTIPTGWTGYPSKWKVTVTGDAENGYIVDVKDINGRSAWPGGITFNEWYWTNVARTQDGTGNASWEGFWEADANSLLVYNFPEDGIVPAGFGSHLTKLLDKEIATVLGVLGAFALYFLWWRRRRRRLHAGEVRCGPGIREPAKLKRRRLWSGESRCGPGIRAPVGGQKARQKRAGPGP